MLNTIFLIKIDFIFKGYSAISHSHSLVKLPYTPPTRMIPAIGRRFALGSASKALSVLTF